MNVGRKETVKDKLDTTADGFLRLRARSNFYGKVKQQRQAQKLQQADLAKIIDEAVHTHTRFSHLKLGKMPSRTSIARKKSRAGFLAREP